MRKRKKQTFTLPTPVRVTGYLFMALFAAMIFYLCHYAYANRQVMMSNSYNSRQKILLEQDVRGEIVARSGEVLAQTVTGEDGKERRVYPYANVFAHAVGYATKGKAGVEALENYYLIRSDISLSKKAGLSEAGQKYPGDRVTTTLDVNLQQVAHSALAAYRGAIVVTDVRTGEILAMVSKPDYDPNEIDAIWDSLIGSENDSRLLNRVSQGMYPPGSTFKIVTALEYLREHPKDYNTYQFSCNGKYVHGDEVIHCFHGESHGAVDFFTSFQKSCNSSFANIGVSLNRGDFARTLKELCFNEELPVEFTCAKSRADLNRSSADGDVMQTAIGQGATAMTPLHLNMITQAVANDGVMLAPFLIHSVDSADDKNLMHREKGEEIGRVMSSEESATLTEMMELVVNGGTGRRLSGQPYQAAGKTGSAEYDSSQKTESHAWFTGFAPAEAPEIAVTVIIEEAGSGGEYAVPMAKRIFDCYFGVE